MLHIKPVPDDSIQWRKSTVQARNKKEGTKKGGLVSCCSAGTIASLFNVHTYPGVANCDLVEATAISQLATSWHPAAVASPMNETQEKPSIIY